MSSASTTSLLLPAIDPQPLVASVVAADATATTYVLNCPSGTDGNDCGVYDYSLTLGPWASATPLSGQPTTGVFDMFMGDDDFTYSAHCPMSHTVVSGGPCTIINVGGNNDGTETVTVTSGDDAFTDEGFAAFSYNPVTITAGLEHLAAATASATATKTSDSASATKTGTAASTGSASGTATGTAGGKTSTSSSSSSTSSSSSSTPSSSSSSSSSNASPRASTALFGLLAMSLALASVSVF